MWGPFNLFREYRQLFLQTQLDWEVCHASLNIQDIECVRRHVISMPYIHCAVVLAAILATLLNNCFFFNKGHFNSLELSFFVFDYFFIKLDFINDAVKLLKFCNDISCLAVKVRTLLLGCDAVYSDKFVNILEEPTTFSCICLPGDTVTHPRRRYYLWSLL